MENKHFRCSINSVPSDQSKLRSSSIPIFFNVDFQNEDLQAPIIKDEMIRCSSCKAYLNPYVEIIVPGFKWKCNLCSTVNETASPFQMSERRTCENYSDPFLNSQFNKTYFLREELRNDIYEIEASDSFAISTPDAQIYCFIIEVTTEGCRSGVLSSVLNCIKEIFKTLNCNKRAKVAFMFFTESVYVLNNNYSMAIVNGEVPLILSDKILFSVDPESANSVFNFRHDLVEAYFSSKKSIYSNYLLAIKLAIQAFRSASLFSFVSTVPNFLDSRVVPSTSLICTNKEYRTVADSLVRKNLCSNLFIMARGSVELSSLKTLSQYTGGQVFYYSNYDGNDAVCTSKFFSDFLDYFNKDIGYGAVCRIRSNEGILLKGVYGNFFQKGPDLLAYSNFNPGHALNFSIQLFNDVKNALYVQIAMIRVTRTGMKLIRVMNICIPITFGSFYESCDANAIAHALVLESFYHESKAKGSGHQFLETSLKTIWKEVKQNNGVVPEKLQNLPVLILSLMKGIPLRPDLETPPDFRVFYMYLLSNATCKIADLIAYPLLLNLLSENVVPIPLSISYIEATGIYILDTGVNMFFYIGKDCDPAVVSSLFQDIKSGPFLFYPPENEFSKYVSDMVAYLLENRSLKPKFILVNGSETSVYGNIFFSYLYEDRMHKIASSAEFMNSLDSK